MDSENDRRNVVLVRSNQFGGSLNRLLVSFVSLLLLLVVGKYLWNNVLVKIVDIVKPVKSVWQLLGFVVLVKLIFC